MTKVRKLVAQEAMDVMDAALVAAGHAAEKRQHRRALKAALKKAGKVALVAGATVVAVAAARATGKGRASP
jgi:hypothetical protein